MKGLKSRFQNVSLGIAVLLIGLAVIGSVWAVTEFLTKDEKGIVEVVEFTGKIEEKREAPLVDISYEEMRVYVFPSGSMAVFKSPQYLQYLPDGTHMIMTVEDGTLKVTVMSNNWDYYTIYCKEDSLLFFGKEQQKDKSKKKRDF